MRLRRVVPPRCSQPPRARKTTRVGTVTTKHMWYGVQTLRSGFRAYINTQIDFATLPTAALHRYLVQYDLVPNIYPSPLCAEDPPPPGSLLHPGRLGSRNASPPPPSPATTTPANRPRREPKDHASRRRSSRLLEDDLLAHGRVPVLADVGEVHVALAVIAQRHFREHGVKEVDTLASFMYALSKSKVQ